MSGSARRRRKAPERRGLARSAASAAGAAVTRNPMLAGGATAFLVALSYVSANALWYQPHFHQGAFFQTRDSVAAMPGPNDDTVRVVTTIRVEPESGQAEAEEASAPRDPRIELVQGILRDLTLFDGEVDGRMGPQTRRSIENYQAIIGLERTGEVDDDLLRQLGVGEATASIAPSPGAADAPVPRTAEEAMPLPSPAPGGAGADERVARVQAGLRAFGNDGIEIDGIVGPQTRSAIREFQSLFGLPVTGEVDETLHAKMREIGLTD